MRTVDAARHKWPEILKRLGLDDCFLLNRHGSCPLCGGDDRYRFDDKDGNGTYYCNGCGAGDGMSLAVKFTGKQFVDVARDIDGFVGNIKAEQSRPQKAPSIRIRKIQSELQRLATGCPASLYLKSRGLPTATALRWHKGLPYYEQGNVLGTYPAMVAHFSDSEFNLVTLHVTYLTSGGGKAPVPNPKKILSPIGKMNGGAVRLTKPYETIGIAEGIETALAVMKKFKVPCWSSTNAVMMEAFIPPKGVANVNIYADNDISFVGHKSAYVLAARLHNQGYGVKVLVPDDVGDFADV